MNSKNTRQFAKSMPAVMVIALLVVIFAWRYQDAIWSVITILRDRDALVAFLDQFGMIGPLVLMVLVGLQTIVASLPGEPLMIAGAYVYGFAAGFLMNWLGAVIVSQAVFLIARFTGRPLIERIVPENLLDKWTVIAGDKGTIFFFLAFVIPLIPSDMMNYVAGVSGISGRRFFVANFVGRIPMIALITLVGAYGFRITPAIILGLTVFGLLMLIAWWYFIVREHPDAALVRQSVYTNFDP